MCALRLCDFVVGEFDLLPCDFDDAFRGCDRGHFRGASWRRVHPQTRQFLLQTTRCVGPARSSLIAACIGRACTLRLFAEHPRLTWPISLTRPGKRVRWSITEQRYCVLDSRFVLAIYSSQGGQLIEQLPLFDTNSQGLQAVDYPGETFQLTMPANEVHLFHATLKPL